MKYKIKGLLLIGVLLLSGCGSDQSVVEIKSLKHAMVVLNSTKNYTLETENSVSGKISYIYTENSLPSQVLNLV